MKLILGDSLQKLKDLPTSTVDAVITSPPYDNLRKYADLPFEKFEVIAQELSRIIKNGGVIVWVVGDATVNGSETGTSFKQALYFKEIGLNLHDTMIYEAEKPPLTHRRYEQKFEYMFVFSKGAPKTFNPIMLPCKHAGVAKFGTFRHDGETLGKRNSPGPVRDTKIKGNVWFYDVGKFKTTKYLDAFKHPAIFPEKLAEDHVISWTNPGDIILDPFMGSGTTAVMALKHGRQFIGIEREADYIEIARRRIKHWQKFSDAPEQDDDQMALPLEPA